MDSILKRFTTVKTGKYYVARQPIMSLTEESHQSIADFGQDLEEHVMSATLKVMFGARPDWYEAGKRNAEEIILDEVYGDLKRKVREIMHFNMQGDERSVHAICLEILDYCEGVD